jgi:hypothetical protein
MEASDHYRFRFSLLAFIRRFRLLQNEPFVFFLSSSSVSMVEKITVLPPRDPWPISSVTDEDLEALVEAYMLRPCSTDP